MADIAQIGFAADTSDLERAEGTLKRLPPAVNAVEKATASLTSKLDNVSAAAAGVSTETTKATKAITAANTNLASQSTTIDKVTASYKKLADIQGKINKTTGVTGGNDNSARAADIDAYGKSLDALRAKYNPLFAAGQAYKTQLGEIRQALKVGAINQREYASAIQDAKVGFVGQVASIQGTNNNLKTFNTQVDKTKKSINGMSWEAKNLSFQLVDVGQGILAGVSPFQIFAQQAGQIGQAIGTSKNGLSGMLKEIGKSIASILTPARLLALGFIAIAAAALFSVTSTAASSRALDDLSKSIDVGITKLHELQQTAAFKGISTDEFSAGMKGFANSVYQAKQNTGDLNGLMIANNMRAKDFEGYWNNVADLVSRTTSGIQKQKILEAAGLPTTQAWANYMSQGSKGIAAAASETVKFNAAAEANLIKKAREFDEAWNKATTKMSQYFKSAVIESMDWVDKLNTKTLLIVGTLGAIFAVILAPFSMVLAGLTAIVAAAAAAKGLMNGMEEKKPTRVVITGGTTEAKPGAQPKTQAELITANQQAQQRISILGELMTVEQQVTLKQLELNAAYLNSVGPTDAQAKAIMNLSRATALNNQVQQQAAIGVFNLDTANKAAQLTLQSWIDKKLLDPTNAQQMAAAHQVLARSIDQSREAAQLAATPFQALKQLEMDSNNFTKVIDQGAVGAIGNLSSALGDVFNRTVSVGQGFKNMGNIILQALQQAIIKLMIIGPLMKAFTGGFGGLFGGGGVSSGGGTGFSTTGTGGLYAKGGVFANDNVQRFADGGAFTNQVVNKTTYFANGGKLAAMGEAGPEAIMPLKRGPGGSLGVQMYGGSKTPPSQSITYAPSYTLGGNVTQEDLAAVKKAQAADRAKFTANVAKSNRELSRRNIKTGAR